MRSVSVRTHPPTGTAERPILARSGPGGFLRALLQSRLAGLGVAVLLVILFMAATADFLTPYDPNYQDYASLFQAPSALHPFGTDEIGRDVYSRVVYGSRISLEVGVIAVGIGLGVGVPLGLIAGYNGGLVDEGLMRLMDAMRAFPALVLALAITATLGPGIGNLMIAIGIVYIPTFARLVRGQAIAMRERDFVIAAKAIGGSPWRIMFRHIWPNITAPIIVQASLGIAFAILAEASLSFLGLGVRPPTASWGSMLLEGYQYLSTAPWLSLYPGVAIFIAVFGFNLLGDGLRQALDPRLKARGTA
ncbi:MAG TPA: ABC transporter permease [Chloroflexota bacterium]|nr:ABC transporter permease [Chloroflexota bacterium]